ncbi:hypothetical protein K3G63_03320 [Hymenobacter sp. HSC-4F20]|uniref:hypothetical protein n=1 Tax=Hymenobacter sp. HSC-4F20 TaxID=2864135 RepID=UPI001C72D3CB|nr:hypothetical protein [Hymenobacter sp. HSC-4F20]MBX0289449.1 hypothetical protein [Hymenobacter sp. HSC-4F20]
MSASHHAFRPRQQQVPLAWLASTLVARFRYSHLPSFWQHFYLVATLLPHYHGPQRGHRNAGGQLLPSG